MQKRWDISESISPEIHAQFPAIPPLILQLLWKRGMMTQEAIDQFLVPDYARDLHDPFLFRDMRRACERAWEALLNGERIVVHGDYDADGVTGSTVLISTFREIGRAMEVDVDQIVSYIPHREKEGYGVHNETIKKLAAEKTGLMITVDCGISCAEEIALATEHRIDTIVVDHHQLPEKLPECLILHPLAPGETYPYKSLAAVGVSFKFACGFVRYAAEQGVEVPAGFEKWLLDLVSIATVTDFMPLIGENRTLEKFGLVVLNKTKRPGLKQLIENAGLRFGELDTTSVGFYIGPRINAASRMEHASLALDTLLSETTEEAIRTAAKLEQCNKDRQKYTETLVVEARQMLEAQSERKVLVFAGDGWSAGVVGIVAGKFASEFGKPVFVFGKDGDRYVGSGRSIAQFNVVKGMEKAKEFLSRFGGHPQACGLTIIGEENFQHFSRIIEEYAQDVLKEVILQPVVPVDAELRLSQITWELIEWLNKFEPFGEGNPRPKFLLRNVKLASIDPIGQTGKHVRLKISDDSTKNIKCIGFNFFEYFSERRIGDILDIIVDVGVNEWNGNKEVQVKLIDAKMMDEQKNETIIKEVMKEVSTV